MTKELYKVHRPSTFAQVIGQDEAVRSLVAMARSKIFPHALLFTGPSGCGKTTLARIVKRKLNCGDADYIETDAASKRGIDMVRDIQKRISLAPIGGDCRIWLIDECHQLTTDAQGAFLKILEDTPQHVYFMLATTDPHKLSDTIKTRCTEISVKPLKAQAVRELVDFVSGKEEVSIPDEVVDKITLHCEGSARKALVLLNAVIGIEDVDEQMDAIESSDSRTQAFELARMLFNPRATWDEVASLLGRKELEGDPEGIRRMVLGYARSVLLGGKKGAPRAYLIIDAFRDNFFDSGKAGLAAACWEIIKGV